MTGIRLYLLGSRSTESTAACPSEAMSDCTSSFFSSIYSILRLVQIQQTSWFCRGAAKRVSSSTTSASAPEGCGGGVCGAAVSAAGIGTGTGTGAGSDSVTSESGSEPLSWYRKDRPALNSDANELELASRSSLVCTILCT